MPHTAAGPTDPALAESVVPVRRAATLGTAYGLVFGLLTGLVVVVLYLAGSATTGVDAGDLLALVPSGLLYVVAPVTAVGAGVGAATGVLSRRQPTRAPLIGAGVAAAAAVLVAMPLGIAGFMVFVLGAGVVGILLAAGAGVLLGRRLRRAVPDRAGTATE